MPEPLQLLFKYGHHNNPAHPNTVTEDSLEILEETDEDARAMITSYQEFFCKELNDLCEHKYHGRQLNIDGEIGPATLESLLAPRCGVPDFGNLEANWPESCRNELVTSYSMNLSGLNNTDMKIAWEIAQGNWNVPLRDVQMTLNNGEYPRTHIWARARSLQTGVLAWSYLARDNCSFRCEQAYNNRVSWSKRLFIPTVGHEIGHALGIGHLQDTQALMYPRITSASMNRGGTPNESDLAAAERIGYKVGDEPEPPPPPPPPPDAELEILDGALRIKTTGAGTWNLRLTK